ncbi:hypothetical protein LguiB_004781 [Lonicera macranthoides]
MNYIYIYNQFHRRSSPRGSGDGLQLHNAAPALDVNAIDKMVPLQSFASSPLKISNKNNKIQTIETKTQNPHNKQTNKKKNT